MSKRVKNYIKEIKFVPNKLEHIKALNGMSEDEWRFWSKVDTSRDCWIWTGAITPQGYGLVSFNGKPVSAHRIAWFLATGEKLTTAQVLMHKCDNPKCVNPDHLDIGTSANNMHDMIAKGRKKSIGSPKLSYTLAKEIREEYENGSVTQEQLSIKYSVSIRNIQDILSFNSWKPGEIHKSTSKSILQMDLW